MSVAAAGRAGTLLRSRRRGGRAVEVGLLSCLLVALLVLLVLVYEVTATGLGVLLERGTEFLEAGLSSAAGRAGVGQGLFGSFIMAALVAAVAFPLGVATAVYLEEYADDTRLNRFVETNVRNLAGVPSIVFGLLGFALFVDELGVLTGGSTLLSGGLTLGLLVLPVVIVSAAEALRAVPASVREAGYGAGATRWQVVSRLVLPGAAPGILTGTILALARALGETAPLLLVGAVTGFLATASGGPLEALRDRFTALPVIVFSWARQPSADFRELTAAAVIVLLAVTVAANAAAIWLRNRYEKRW